MAHKGVFLGGRGRRNLLLDVGLDNHIYDDVWNPLIYTVSHNFSKILQASI
jgi:hypothetical protein